MHAEGGCDWRHGGLASATVDVCGARLVEPFRAKDLSGFHGLGKSDNGVRGVSWYRVSVQQLQPRSRVWA